MGGRSNRAANILKEKGFTKIFDYSGGYNDWVQNQ
jgi:rhodanese-related sulfurtransferase